MTTLQIIMLILAVAGLTVIMLSTRRKVRSRSAGPAESVRETYREMSRRADTQRTEHEAARQTVEEIMIELDALSRQIHSRIDTKFAKLEAVIRAADERIERLSRVVRESRGEPSCEVTIADEVDPIAEMPTTSPAKASDPRRTTAHQAVYRLADAGRSCGEIADTLGKPKGEVELILALRRAKDTPASTS